MEEETKEVVEEHFDPASIFKGEDGMDLDDFGFGSKWKKTKKQRSKKRPKKVSNNLRLFARQLQ